MNDSVKYDNPTSKWFKNHIGDQRTICVEFLVPIGDGLYYDSSTKIVYWWKGYYDSCSSITPSPYYAPNGLPYRYNPKTNMLEEIKLKEDIIEMFQEIIAELHAKNAELSMKNKEIEELLKTDKMSGAMDSSGGNYEAAFADNTWAEIAVACKQKTVPSTWKVGDTKEMKINGTSYTVAIIGKNHDTYADGSGKAPLTFQVIDIVEKRKMNSIDTNRGSWDGSAMYSYLQNDMLNSIEADIKNNIKAVSKKTNLGGADTSNWATTTETSSDKLFLLSEVEIIGSSFFTWSNEDDSAAYYNVFKEEGIQYEYYKSNGSVTTEPTDDEFCFNDFNYWYSMNKATLKYNGVASAWWLRTPVPDNYCDFFYVDASGFSYDTDYVTSALGVSFGFCF